MAKKYNSQQTIESILSVSAELFNEKGYENTSMQDIVNALRMSKGAIFHHFTSKEDILKTVAHRQAEHDNQMRCQWLDEMQGLTAKEKLVGLLERNIRSEHIRSFNSMLYTQLVSPHIVITLMQNSVNIVAPQFAKIMREGVNDGSITTEYPEECAEVFILLHNIWCTHTIFERESFTTIRKLKYLQQVMKSMGADIISDSLIHEYMQFIENEKSLKNNSN